MKLEALESRRLLAAGELDLSFGDNGVLSPEIDNSDFIGIAPAGNNRFFVFQSGSFDSSLQRIDANGATDPTFGDAGFAALHGVLPDRALPLPSGKILVVDHQSGDVATFLERLNADGTQDSTFGSGGFVTFASQRLPQIGVQSDGKIILWRSDDNTSVNTIIRLSADGSSDSSFTTFTFQNDFSPTAAMVVLSDDRILLGGRLSDDKNVNTIDAHDYSFIRLNANGTADTTFATSYNNSNRVPRTPDGSVFNPEDIALVAGGNGNFVAAAGADTAIKFNADGSIDSTFHSPGNTRAIIRGLINPYRGGRLLAQSDGKFILYTSFSMARLNADGTLDESFGRIYQSDPTTIQFQGAALTASGDILAGASAGARFQSLVRIQGSGTNDPRIALNGSTLHVNGTEGNDAISFPTDLPVPGFPDPPQSNPVGDDIAVLFVGGIEKLVDRAGVSLLNVAGRGGNDVINMFSEGISATISGGDGNDSIAGGLANDSISGNAGNDRITGMGGDDRIAGNGGRDKLAGQDDNDRLFGGAGGDWLAGQAGNDILKGDAGGDLLDGGDGTDTFAGGAGDDTFESVDFLPESLFGDGGDDSASRDDTDILSSIENDISQQTR